MTDLDLDAIQARAGAATDGPWDVEIGEAIEVNAGTAKTVWDEAGRFGKPARSWRFTDRILEVECADYDLPDEDYAIVAANATFIAHARTDVPALIAEVKALRGKVAEVKRLARLDLKCPCCTGYGNILDSLQSSAPTTGEPDE